MSAGKIRWARDFERECGDRDGKGGRCIKDRDHLKDPTNDDHQCCCGDTWEAS